MIMVANAFHMLGKFVLTKHKAVIGVSILGAFLCAFYIADLRFDISLLELLDPDLPVVQSYKEIRSNFGDLDPLILALEFEKRGKAEHLADRLADRIANLKIVNYVDYQTLMAGGESHEEMSRKQFPQPHYYVSNDEKMLLIFIYGNGPGDEYEFASRLLSEVKAASMDVVGNEPSVRLKFGGGPVLVIEKQDALTHDLPLTTVIALVGVLLIFMISFRSISVPFLAAVPLVMGIIWTLGFVKLVFGHLSLLTAPFIPVLAGLGIDYGIHLIARFDEERVRCPDLLSSLQKTLSGAGRSILTGAITTSGAFFTISLASLHGFSEAGLTGGVGILITFLATIIVLPSLLVLRSKFFSRGQTKAVQWSSLSKLGLLAEKRPRILIGVWSAILVLAAFFAATVHYDTDILGQEVEGEAVMLFRELDERFPFGMNFGIIPAADFQETYRITERLDNSKNVGHVIGPPTFLSAQNGMPATATTLIESVRKRFVGRDGSLALYAYPKGRNPYSQPKKGVENSGNNWRRPCKC